MQEGVQPVAHVLAVVAAHAFVGDDGSDLLQPRFELGAFLRRVERSTLDLALPDHVGKGSRIGEHLVEGRATLVAHQIVRILAVRQHRETHRAARLQVRQRQVDATIGGTDAGAIAVEAEHRLRRHLPEKVELVFGQCRAERRNRVLDARLVQRDHVHVAFDGDDRSGGIVRPGVTQAGGPLRGPAGAGEIVEHVALVEELGLVGVQIFRRRIRRHRATAEGDDLFA
ncbi:hypothetical protein D9M72_438780 [compost metagenome]